MTLLCLTLLQAPGGAAAQQSSPVRDAIPTAARDILKAAFANYYGCDSRAEVEILIRGRSGSGRRRVLEMAAKEIGGRRHGIAQLTAPAHLRGMSFLTIESGGGGHEAFIYLPSQQRVRRVSVAQQEDAFLGSDLTYEDIQRRRAEDYDLDLLSAERVGEELAYALRARPRIRAAYDHLEILIARVDLALLEVRYFDSRADSPYRIIRMPRSGMHEAGGHVVPTRIHVEHVRRGSRTEVTYRDLQVNPRLEDRLFAPSWLERAQMLRAVDTP